MKKGKVIIITAPSGAGKTTLAKKLMHQHKDILFSVSATTRAPRKGEVHGKDYFFLSKEEFNEKVAKGEFIEWEEFYNGTLYGTLRSHVEYHLKNGYFVLFDVEVKGAANLKNIFGESSISFFISPPDFQTLESRLKSRGTENEQTIQLRLDRAKMELNQAHGFDHTIVNDDFNHAYEQLNRLVTDFMKQ
jgi:guanylate kinase